jgi:hypothetical protein
MTQFALKINEDVVNFIKIPVDNSGVPLRSHDIEFFDVLKSNPSVIEITDLQYNPYLDSEWDGENFIDSQNREPLVMPENLAQDKKFAFVVDNKYKLFYGVVNSPNNEMIIAALSSNPQVVIN